MYRPALVIGLGGTGVLTLRHLKAQLLASQDRRVPPQVRLIALDTVKDKKQSAQTSGDQTIAALRTDLEPGEYFWIGGNVYDYAREVAQGQHPQVGAWFQAQTYLDTLPPASFFLETGAGQLRQFGRLAIFNDVSAPNLSAIRTLINTNIDEIRRAGGGYVPTIDVFLIASVAGGTGAGMFVDIAYLIRQIAGQEHASLGVRLRGFLVLPEAFSAISGGVTNSMRARAFACMRENKRFMVDFQSVHGYPMYYHDPSAPDGGVWRSRIKTKLFDFLYHVDGQSTRNPLTAYLPEFGVTAAIADTVAAMIDRAPGGGEDVYDVHTTNVMAAKGQAADAAASTAFDSAVGTYSIILPMHHITSWLAYKLALAALKTLVVPSSLDEDQFPIALAPDANAEIPGVMGRNMAPRFFTMSEIVSTIRPDDRVAGTPFLQDLVRVATTYKPGDDTIPNELASRDAHMWERQLDPPGTDPILVAKRNRVQMDLNSRLETDVPASMRGEPGASAAQRIIGGVEAYKGLHLGAEDLRSGQRAGGQYRASLQEYTDIQIGRFKLMLALETENNLNGGLAPDQPRSVHRGGKLGYLIDYLDGVSTILGRFLTALAESRQKRDERQDKQTAVATAQTARQEMEQKPDGFFAGGRRQACLTAEQRSLDVEKNLVIEDAVRALADAMRVYTDQLKGSAESWRATLAIGQNSLYSRLMRGERQVRDAIAAEQRIPVRETVWDDAYLNLLYSKYAEQLQHGVDEYLDRLFWRYAKRPAGATEEYEFRLYIKVSDDDEKNRMGLSNQDRNLELMLGPARDLFAGAWKQESVLKYLMSVRYPDPNALAQVLADKGGTMLDAQGPQVVPANYLHVAHGADPTEGQYLTQVQQRLHGLTQAAGKLNSVVNTDDRFVMRLVFTKDLIPLDGITSYTKSEPAYWSEAAEVDDRKGIRGHIGRETLHVFPAEVNATKYESRIAASRLKLPARALHNDVVLQMEDLEEFRLFVGALAFELIHPDQIQGSGTNYENLWALDLPSEDQGKSEGPEPAVTIYLTRPRQGDPNVVEAMRNWNYHRRDARDDPNYFYRIDYDRVRRAVKTKHDEVVASIMQKPDTIYKNIDENNPTLRKQIDDLSQADKERYLRHWAEKMYLAGRQRQFEPDIRGNDRTRQDAAIAIYLAIDDDITSLNKAMNQILRAASTVR